MPLFHHTDAAGFKAIGSQPDWLFKASQPPCNHPFVASFTTLGPATITLSRRLRIPRGKLEYVFCFLERFDLLPLPGGRGAYIFYSPTDYPVTAASGRQRFAGTTIAARGTSP